uniref:RNase H type-1 domain-containing protein n=2 Tax=Gossypium raimondii TaxID=29730 RepID=A0A0D2SGI9_GOSRA|nr:hypothetical protein B456_005G137200 [Gossypium raimondii]
MEELGFQEVVVKGDALVVIEKLRALEEDKSTISILVKEIKFRLDKFESMEFRFVPCQRNREAHSLAEKGRRYGDLRFWIEEAPRTVEVEVEKDRRVMQGRV